MIVQKALQHLGHVGIGSVYLVDDEKTAAERAAAQVRMFDRKSGEHGLIDCADGNLCGQKPGGVFRGPAAWRSERVVVPSHFPMRQALALVLPRSQHTGDGQHGFR